jgi:hypothetical protein
MARTTRSQQSSKNSPQSKTKAGTKRSADTSSSPVAKRGKSSKKYQKTIEETMGDGENEEVEAMDGIEDDEDVAEQIAGKGGELEDSEGDLREDDINKKEQNGGKHDKDDGAKKSQNGAKNSEKNAFDEIKADTDEVQQAAKDEQESKTAQISENSNSVIEDDKREAEIPSSIMEKGIIYFFFRGRVGIEDPQGINDVARSYIVLRPLPLGANIGEGPLQDDGKARLIALPKKMLPKTKRDRFLTFVEKAGTSIKDLRDGLAGSEYATKTAG